VTPLTAQLPPAPAELTCPEQSQKSETGEVAACVVVPVLREAAFDAVAVARSDGGGSFTAGVASSAEHELDHFLQSLPCVNTAVIGQQ
jgi:hypothetical protein